MLANDPTQTIKHSIETKIKTVIKKYPVINYYDLSLKSRYFSQLTLQV